MCFLPDARLAWVPDVAGASASAAAQEWSRRRRPPPGFLDPVTGWRHRGIGLWMHPDGHDVAEWCDTGGLWTSLVHRHGTDPDCYSNAPQTLRAAVLYAHQHHGVPLAGQLARDAGGAP